MARRWARLDCLLSVGLVVGGAVAAPAARADPPLLSGVPSNVTLEATSSSGAPLSWTQPTSTDDNPLLPIPVVICLPGAGAFPLGSTSVTCSAVDTADLSVSSATFTVNVVDTTPPTLSGVPGDISVAADTTGGADVGYTPPTATDAVDSSPTVSCTPSPGSLFPVGVTTVGCNAADHAVPANASSASFRVTVPTPRRRPSTSLPT